MCTHGHCRTSPSKCMPIAHRALMVQSFRAVKEDREGYEHASKAMPHIVAQAVPVRSPSR